MTLFVCQLILWRMQSSIENCIRRWMRFAFFSLWYDAIRTMDFSVLLLLWLLWRIQDIQHFHTLHKTVHVALRVSRVLSIDVGAPQEPYRVINRRLKPMSVIHLLNTIGEYISSNDVVIFTERILMRYQWLWDNKYFGFQISLSRLQRSCARRQM